MDKGYVMQDMRQSMNYLDKARPIIARMLGGGKTMTVEGDDNEVCKILDMTCGTDYIHVYDEKGICWGVASRMQNYPNQRTFTVRKERESGAKTEWEKRKYAILHGGIYPFLTMQGYVQNGEIVGLAITKTTDLMRFVDTGCAYQQHTRADQKGQATFWVCCWDDMRKQGIKVIEWP